MKIPFNKPPFVGNELAYIEQAVRNGKICGDGEFNLKCHEWLETRLQSPKALLTTSCTHALEMAALLISIAPGDEVIMPSFTFVSTANAFVLRGAKVVFVDVRPDTMNIDENKIEAAITEKTKAIVPVHYAGVAAEMDTIDALAKKYGLMVIEDAAQALMSKYKGRALGALGDFGCFSFHETKNYSMGEGGALLIKDVSFAESAEVLREKGTNRAKFHRGLVDKYTWVDLGSSYLPSELNAAYLYAQLEAAELILHKRLEAFNFYKEALYDLEVKKLIEVPKIPKDCEHNGHMFYIKVKSLEVRGNLIEFLQKNGILAIFHYVPLHSSPAGRLWGRFSGEDVFTTKESDRLLRLPLFYGISKSDLEWVVQKIREFFA